MAYSPVFKLNFDRLHFISMYWFISGCLSKDRVERPKFDEIFLEFQSFRKNLISFSVFCNFIFPHKFESLFYFNPGIESRRNLSSAFTVILYFKFRQGGQWKLSDLFNIIIIH